MSNAATVQFSANDVCAGSQTTFISNSTPDSGTIVQFLWDFDNDSIFDDGSGITENKLFTTAGTYSVGLMIISNYGDTNSVYQDVVINPIAIAGFVAPEVCEQVATSFTSTSTISDGSIVNYEWEFDNNSLYDDATGANSSNVFPSYGTFLVGLRVTSDSGCVSIVGNNITVNPLPSVDFTFNEVRQAGSKQSSFKIWNAKLAYRKDRDAKWEYELVGNNLLATGSETSVNIGNFSTSINERFILPRFISFRVRYQL